MSNEDGFIIDKDSDIESNDFMDDIFKNNDSKDKTSYDVLNELFSGVGIRTRTELSMKEICLINKKRALAKLLQWDNLQNVLNDYMMLKISLKRQGRAEFVDAFKAERANEIGSNRAGWFSKVGDMFK